MASVKNSLNLFFIDSAVGQYQDVEYIVQEYKEKPLLGTSMIFAYKDLERIVSKGFNDLILNLQEQCSLSNLLEISKKYFDCIY